MEPFALGALVLALLAIIVLHARSLSAHAVERERLIQLVAAKDGREYAQLRKASAEPPAPSTEKVPEPEVQIGMGG